MEWKTLALLGDPEMGRMLGKKGTVSDITFYNLKKPELGLTMVEPTMHPDKAQPLATVLAMADAIVIAVGAVDKTLGELIVAADCFGISRGVLVLKNYITFEQVSPLLRGTSLEGLVFSDYNSENLMDAVQAIPIAPVEGPVKVPIDHYFNVKGVGTVALGCVRKGTLRQHSELEVFPEGKKALVRSIQVHDEDAPEAGFGSRVGVALKGIDASELYRGCVLGEPGSLSSLTNITLDYHPCKYYRQKLEPGAVVHICSGLQIRQARINSYEDKPTSGVVHNRLSLNLDKPVSVDGSSRIVVMDLDAKDLRFAGWGTVTGQ